MITGAFTSGISMSKAIDWFESSGITSPGKKSFLWMRDHVKKEVMTRSLSKLTTNRKRHNTACRRQKRYKGDLKWTDKMKFNNHLPWVQ